MNHFRSKKDEIFLLFACNIIYFATLAWLESSPVLNLVPVPPVSEFNYTFKIVADEKYGKKNQETGEWNGMMGELLAQVKKICMQIQGGSHLSKFCYRE